MCVATLAWRAHPRWPLVVLANRDEFHDRPAAPLAAWNDGSGIVAGRDLRSGGTWLGVQPARGRLVLVTNFRAPGYPQPDRPSRGALVTGLLAGADARTMPVTAYNPFNLFATAPDAAWFIGNHPDERREVLTPGVHGLSNGAFDHPWPKARALASALADWLAGPTSDPASDPATLFAPLADASPFAADEAPGDGPEPRHSPVFIRDPGYGTRCSSVIAIDAAGAGMFAERRFAADGSITGETALTFAWPPLAIGGPCP